MKRLLVALLLLLPVACSGDFDQRVDIARKIGAGSESVGSTANPSAGVFITGSISTGGVFKRGMVTLRPVREDGSIERDDGKNLGVSISLDNGGYQVNLRNANYRGPVVVEVRGGQAEGVLTTGGNPATGLSNPAHVMGQDHVMYGVAPNFEGQSIFNVHVTPLTTFAVTRGEFFGGVSAGMFGLMCRQTADFFGLRGVRQGLPVDFTGTFAFGTDFRYGCVLAALSQVAANAGVANIFDFYQGMAEDGRDDGMLNGSIGFVPNTGVTMPDLSAPDIIGAAFAGNFLAPGNLERKVGFNNTAITPGSELEQIVTILNSARNINSFSYPYNYVVRVPDTVELWPGQQVATRVLAIEHVDPPVSFEAYGDSGGPSFVDFSFVSSSPSNVSVQPFGRIVAAPGAVPGFYTLTLTVSPGALQTFVSGPTKEFTITVRVR